MGTQETDLSMIDCVMSSHTFLTHSVEPSHNQKEAFGFVLQNVGYFGVSDILRESFSVFSFQLKDRGFDNG